MKKHKKICIIGAGPSGITAAKNCIEAGLEAVVFEKNDKVGGNWVFNAKTGHSSVYNNTHIISSKIWSEYEDYPMPSDYPDYPSHSKVQKYFEDYAKHFGVLDVIRFNHQIEKAALNDSGDWNVTYVDQMGQSHQEVFSHLMVANGHHWDPKYPHYEGEFSGTYIHSHDFKSVDDSWRGKKVLVIGAGNSGCDVAVEAARVAQHVSMSMRSPQWFIPKFMFGIPSDVLGSFSSWLPRKFKQLSLTFLLRMFQGRYRQYGLPEPTNLVLSQHPTANSDLLDFIRHGRIKPQPAIKRLKPSGVEFIDGQSAEYDIIVACTGFKISFPFFDEALINFQSDDKVPLYKKMLHKDYPNLYFIGLFQPLGCIWPLADYQAKLACQEILGNYRRPSNMQAAIDYEVNHPHYPFIGGTRHSTEVDYHMFRKELKQELRKAGLDIGEAPKGRIDHYKQWQKVG
ncbi:monooxygenase [Aliikangiella marina]|uniref:Monooxygenase n=1 Tax=Aliikangiella marina TaxID=1712262 RepID=A0A545T132_9GAMM|nr:NAD(P)-binding domain-containing protein [Aliikangiella marina]TQV70911.1 monooxygenase [Aliikangiella marina]